MPCTTLALLFWLCPGLVLSLSCKHPGSTTHALSKPRTLFYLPCPESIVVLPCADLDPALPALSYALAIPAARMHPWTSKQCLSEESFCENTTAEHWGFPYNVNVGADGLVFPARSQDVPIRTGSPWWPLQWYWRSFIEGCPQLFGYMVSITVDYPRDHLKPKAIPIEGWLGTRLRQQEWRKKRNGIWFVNAENILHNRLEGLSQLTPFISFVCSIIY